MGFVRSDESRRAEIEEFRRMLMSCSAAVVRKVRSGDETVGRRIKANEGNDEASDKKLVCVTSGVSFLGIAIVKQLLLRGYAVRIIVDNQEDIERLREIENSGEMIATNENVIEVAVAKLNERGRLMEAFDGCWGVFHTAAFVDPTGLSGYSKSMVEIEAKAAENVAEACASTASVRNYVLTSSLLACLWRDNSDNTLSTVVDHNTWSDESFCNHKKLWYALGKLKAERVSWRVAEENELKMTSICAGLIVGPHYFLRNPSSTIAYLKGRQDMYENGLLATIDVAKLAEAHIRVMEEMNKTANGRYICFNNVVRSRDEVERLKHETGVHINVMSPNESREVDFRFKLSNGKLDRLMSRPHRCTSIS